MNIRLSNLRQTHPDHDLRELAARRLRVDVSAIRAFRVVRSSVDSRGRSPVRVLNLDLDVAGADRVRARLWRDAPGAGDPPREAGL